jgi:hypothetical protein
VITSNSTLSKAIAKKINLNKMKKLTRNEMKNVNGGKHIESLCAEFSICINSGGIHGTCSTKQDGCKCVDAVSGLEIPGTSAFCSAA